MNQMRSESGSDFLKRFRRQLKILIDYGSIESKNSAMMTSLVLSGLNKHSPKYSAELADLKTRFKKDNSSITLVDIEEVIFGIDNSVTSSSYERAYYSGGGNSNKNNKYNKSTSSSNGGRTKQYDKSKLGPCYKCGKYGHLKRDCPLLKKRGNDDNKKKVQFESAHHVSHGKDEQCKMAEVISIDDFDSSDSISTYSPYSHTLITSGEIDSISDESFDGSMDKSILEFKNEIGSLSDLESVNSSDICSHCGGLKIIFDDDTSNVSLHNLNDDLNLLCSGRQSGISEIAMQALEERFVTTFEQWLLDSGASSHFTPFLSDLYNVITIDPIRVKVADGTILVSKQQGECNVDFYSDEGNKCTLHLHRVLHLPGLTRRLFSVGSFTSDPNYSVTYVRGAVKLGFNRDNSLTIDLPSIDPSSFEATTSNDDDTSSTGESPQLDDLQADGGEKTDAWNPNCAKFRSSSISRMPVEMAHPIFGHRAITSLLNASKAEVWDDLQLIMTGDNWCDSCKVALSSVHRRSKQPMRMNLDKPLSTIFIDTIPAPSNLRGIKGCNFKDYLFIACPTSKYLDALGLPDKTAATTVKVLNNWRISMKVKGFDTCIHIRSDAGTNFTSKEFKEYCSKENITLSVAAPKHQEQNGIVERGYGTASGMARSMLVHANLPKSFYGLALQYACKILRVLPAKGLVDSIGKPTTPYALIHGKKPRVSRYKVFGCPVVFKRYLPMHNRKIIPTFQQMQRGVRGIFVGFPEDQAGWLVYVDTPLQGSHLVVSQDVVFDQMFVSPLGLNKLPFAGAESERTPTGGAGRPGSEPSEETGDITSLADVNVSHWGDQKANSFTSNLDCNDDESLPDLIDREDYDSDSDSEDEKEDNEDIDDDNDSVSSLPKLVRRRMPRKSNYSSLDDEDTDSDSDNDDDTSNENTTSKKIRRKKRTKYGSEVKSGVRRSRRLLDGLYISALCDGMDEFESAFEAVQEAAKSTNDDDGDIDIDPYLPEPRNKGDFAKLPPEIQKDWIKSIQKEIKFLVNNKTFDLNTVKESGDECIPGMFVFKAKLTSRGHLDKLKSRMVARGDLQRQTVGDTWSPCVFNRTFKAFVTHAVQHVRPIQQLDFIGAFCQAQMKYKLFLQLPKEFAEYVPEYKEYFERPILLAKSIYGTTIAAKFFNDDLATWLTTNTDMKFYRSEVDPCLFIHRSMEGNKTVALFLIVYVDDCLFFGTSDEIEKKFGKYLSQRFNLELQGWSHWFLGTRLYRENDGSYILDQETFVKHVLNRYCGNDSIWGLPPMQSTPAPIDYVFSKANRPKDAEEEQIIKTKYPGLSMASAVSSLLYVALNTRSDILWIVNKLAKSCTSPGMKDFDALMHLFGYLRRYPDLAIKYYAKVEDSPIHDILIRNKLTNTEIVGFTDSSWQDCPDTGRSTCGFKIFICGGIVEAQSTMPVPVALSSAEAEYMGACNCGAMICHFRDLLYDLEYLGSNEYDNDGLYGTTPSILLVDNQATVQMAKNYRVTAKNRHIARRWHFVRQGEGKLFTLSWIPGVDELADDMTKTQPAHKSKIHCDRTLIKLPDKVRGYRSNVVGNR